MFTRNFITTACIGLCVCVASGIGAKFNEQDHKQLKNVVTMLQNQAQQIYAIARNQSGDTERTLINAANSIEAEMNELNALMQKNHNNPHNNGNNPHNKKKDQQPQRHKRLLKRNPGRM